MNVTIKRIKPYFMTMMIKQRMMITLLTTVKTGAYCLSIGSFTSKEKAIYKNAPIITN